MNRKAIILIICVVIVCGAAVLLWGARPENGEPAQPVVPEQTEVAQPAPEPQPLAAETEAVPAPEPEAAPEPVAAETPAADAAPADTTTLNAETLVGTRWKTDMVDVRFLPNGQWEMNGRVCAKWQVEGNRIRVFDEEGETHYVDIDGDSLVFDGEKVSQAEN